MKAFLIFLLFVTCVRAGNIFSLEKKPSAVRETREEQRLWAIEQARLAEELQHDRDHERFLQDQARWERVRLEDARLDRIHREQDRSRQLRLQREVAREHEIFRQRETEHAADLEEAKQKQKELRQNGAPDKEHMKQKTRIRQLITNPPTMIDQKAQFGGFRCVSCGNKWFSANAYQGFRQDCRRCPERTANLPISLKALEKSDEEGFSTGPHYSEGCERCQLALSCRGRR